MTIKPTYRDYRLAEGFISRPELVALDDHRCVACDLSGHLRMIDLETGGVTVSPSAAVMDGLAGNSLRSLSALPSRNLVAAATKATYAAVWDVESNTVQRVGVSGQTCAVCFILDTSRLAVATGDYSLGEVREARLEFLTHDGEWEGGDSIALPGCCVDWIGWNDYECNLAVLSGRASQDGGYLTFIDAFSLRTLRTVPIDFAMGMGIGVYDGEALVCKDAVLWEKSGSFRERVGPFRIGPTRGDDALIETGSTLQLDGSCLYGERPLLVTTSGIVLNFHGEVVAELSPLEGCCRVAPLPGGGLAGLTQGGVLRVWREPPELH